MHRGIVLPTLVFLFAGSLSLAGCSKSNRADDEEVEEAGIAEVADDAERASDRPAAALTPAVAPTQPAPASVVSAAPRNVWPFRKTLVHHVHQPSAEGDLDCRSTLELLMTIARDEGHGAAQRRLPDGQLFRVGFDLVRYSQELTGQPPVVYDSGNPTGVVPAGIRPYQGITGNGFLFELDQQLQLAHVIGLKPFVERCLKTSTSEDQSLVRSALPLSSPTEGVAHFIDDGIGLIPAEIGRAGDSWARSRSLEGPAPCVATMRYAIRQMTSELADVDMTGTIGPLTNPAASGTARAGVQIQIRGGQLLGQYRIDRRSGLPLKSHVEQSLEMSVKTDDGAEFPQHKTTVTAFEMLGDSNAAPSLVPGGRESPAQISSRSPEPPPNSSVRR